MKCNICKTPGVEVTSKEDKTYVKCPRCGYFFMETSTYSDKSTLDIDFMLSSEIRRVFDNKKSIVNAEHLFNDCNEEKAILEKYRILLQYVFDNARFKEFLIGGDGVYYLIAKTNSFDLDELSMLFIKAYEEQHLIDFSVDKEVKVKLTFEGKRFLDEY